MLEPRGACQQMNNTVGCKRHNQAEHRKQRYPYLLTVTDRRNTWGNTQVTQGSNQAILNRKVAHNTKIISRSDLLLEFVMRCIT
jgi:hypothetical protein